MEKGTLLAALSPPCTAPGYSTWGGQAMALAPGKGRVETMESTLHNREKQTEEGLPPFPGLLCAQNSICINPFPLHHSVQERSTIFTLVPSEGGEETEAERRQVSASSEADQVWLVQAAHSPADHL